MEIIKKPKNEKDLDIVLKEISESDNMICYSKKELLHLIQKEDVFFGYEDNQLIGIGIIKEINIEWIELATLIILKEFQGKGYGEQMFEYLFSLIKDKKISSSSRNPITQKWLEDKGFKDVGFFSLPPIVLIHAFKTKLKLYKIKDLILKSLKRGWKYYIRV